MKKVLVLSLCFILVLGTVQLGYTADGTELDSRLKFLLNDETDPFFPDSVRWDFLTMGIKKCGTMCSWVGCQRYWDFLTTGETKMLVAFETPFSTKSSAWHVRGVLLDNDDYALMEIKAKDIGQKKIATNEPSRYWYERAKESGFMEIGIYPVPVDSTGYYVFLSGIPAWADTAYLNPGFENESVLYALYLCKLRQGEREVANFIKQIAINEILDLKAILENRPVDVTLAKEVVPR